MSKIEIFDKFHLGLTNSIGNIGNLMLIHFLPSHCVFILVLSITNQGKRTIAFMANILSPNGNIASLCKLFD